MPLLAFPFLIVLTGVLTAAARPAHLRELTRGAGVVLVTQGLLIGALAAAGG